MINMPWEGGTGNNGGAKGELGLLMGIQRGRWLGYIWQQPYGCYPNMEGGGDSPSKGAVRGGKDWVSFGLWFMKNN